MSLSLLECLHLSTLPHGHRADLFLEEVKLHPLQLGLEVTLALGYGRVEGDLLLVRPDKDVLDGSLGVVLSSRSCHLLEL